MRIRIAIARPAFLVLLLGLSILSQAGGAAVQPSSSRLQSGDAGLSAGGPSPVGDPTIPGEVVVLDRATGTVTVLPQEEASSLLSVDPSVTFETTPPYRGIGEACRGDASDAEPAEAWIFREAWAPFCADAQPASSGPEEPIPPDTRTRVTPTTVYPYTSVVKIYLTDRDGVQTWCSGAMISAFHVLTAGHCVHEGDGGAWHQSWRAVPAMDNGWNPGSYPDRPLEQSVYGYADWTSVRSYTQWTNDGETGHDWALITLDRPVGDWTGWFGRFWADSGHAYWDLPATTAGYPGDLDNGRNMYQDTHDFCTVNALTVDHNLDTNNGQSGSGMWVNINPGDPYVGVVHSNGGDGTDCTNWGTRLVQDKYDRLATWIGEDTRPPTRAELVEEVHHDSLRTNPNQPHSTFSPTMVKPGSTLFNAQIRVRNAGLTSSGAFSVAFRVSTDTTITTSDPLVATKSVSSIGAFSTSDVLHSGTFPSGVPDGTYRVGWIIDSGGAVAEYDESAASNRGYKAGQTLLVDGTAPSASVSSPSTIQTGSYAVSYSTSDGGSGLSSLTLERRLSAGGLGVWELLCTRSLSGASASGSCTSDPLLPGTYCYRAIVTDRVGNSVTTSGNACTTSA